MIDLKLQDMSLTRHTWLGSTIAARACNDELVKFDRPEHQGKLVLSAPLLDGLVSNLPVPPLVFAIRGGFGFKVLVGHEVVRNLVDYHLSMCRDQLEDEAEENRLAAGDALKSFGYDDEVVWEGDTYVELDRTDIDYYHAVMSQNFPIQIVNMTKVEQGSERESRIEEWVKSLCDLKHYP